MFRKALLLVAMIVVPVAGCDSFRTPVQVPVSATIRNSLVGIGNVVRVKNNSNKTLTGVVITGRNPGQNSSATYRIGDLRPGELREAGWLEWNWSVDPGETVTVEADGFLPIVFSSAQLGIR